ncbi:MAG: hypothetical protein IT372_03345 [Polyangiaceae bacterium]|nr:hypothetical protein [Polyangiaceae bacterium]
MTSGGARRRPARALLVAAALAAGGSCARGLPRKADAPAPPPAPAKVNLAPVAFAGQRDVTRSPRMASAAIGKVVVSFPRGAVGFARRADIERIVRRSLLERRVEVVAGEIQARAETNRAMQAQKGQLTEAEQLLLLGKDTGADAVLVFDALGMAGAIHDVAIAWTDAGRMFEARPGPPAPALPACPAGFRMKVPSLFARGRLISTADTTILAEFDVRASLFDRREELAAPADVTRWLPRPERARGVYRSNDGCDTEDHEYEYVASWSAVDVLCPEIQKRLAPHIPPERSWERLEPGVTAAVQDLVAGVFGR